MDELAAEQSGAGGAGPGSPDSGAKTYTADQKLAHLTGYAAWTGTMEGYCAQAGITSASLCAWRRRFKAFGREGLEPQANPRNTGGLGHVKYTPEERRAAVEAWKRSGMTQTEFAKVWGVSVTSLGHWGQQYDAKGPQALERPFEGVDKRSRGRRPLAAGVGAAILGVARGHPRFGIRRVRDWLWRFGGLKVSPGSVRKTMRAAGVPGAKRGGGRRSRPLPRRFERSRPNELWQSDLTSVVLPGTGRRVYLVVFLDDYSRYIVSWGLAMQQRQELVVEALLDGIQRYGKPLEVLTDQGRQYYSWRGKGAFGEQLTKLGIRHVVSRAHHPETLGKCERLWETMREEFWGRVPNGDVAAMRARLVHYIAHYNLQRPHQGIGGLVPADRFFGAESAVRRMVEAAVQANEVRVALGEAPRKPVYLVGQIGEQSVSLVGEQGRLVVQTSEGERTEMGLEELGAAKEAGHGGDEGGEGDEGGDARPAAADGGASAGADAGAGAGVVGGGERGGEDAGAGGGDGAAGDLAGAAEPGGRGEAAGADAGAAVAVEPAGDERDGGGAVAATAAAEAGAGRAHGGGSEAAAEADPGAGAGDDGAAGADRAVAKPAGDAEGGAGADAGGEKKSGEGIGSGWRGGFGGSAESSAAGSPGPAA